MHGVFPVGQQYMVCVFRAKAHTASTCTRTLARVVVVQTSIITFCDGFPACQVAASPGRWSIHPAPRASGCVYIVRSLLILVGLVRNVFP